MLNITERFFILFLFGGMLVHSCKLIQLASSSSNSTDQSALLSFQSTVSLFRGNWTEETHFCNWTGVTCGRRHRERVTSLNLSYMGLHGTISPYIGNLSFLVSLDLRNNSFNGIIPHEISRLHRLRVLMLQFNQLEGSIPSTLYHCGKLQVLSLSGNQLTGGIPEELGFLPSLQELDLRLNNLKGAIPSSLGNISTLQMLTLTHSGLTGSIPSSLFNLSFLISFAILENNISGTLPMDICQYWPNIQTLHVAFNKFGGQIPSGIHHCHELVSLRLGYNMFEGTIPGEIGSLTKLELLDLGGNNLIGTIPPTIGNMSSLRKLYIEENSIRGSIPMDIRHLSNLNELNFEMNNLSGEIPRALFNMSSLQMISLCQNSLSGSLPSGSRFWLPNLEILYLCSNRLRGNIPSYFSNFSELIRLDVCKNLLTGPIPTSLSHLKNLKYLALHVNQLTGEPGNPELSFITALSRCSSLEILVLHSNPLNGHIPDSIGNFSTSFQTLYAPDCQLKGHIPSTIGSLKSLTLLVLSSNNLTGVIPPTIGGLERLQRFFADDNEIEGFIPKEICNLRNLGELNLQNNKITGPIPECIWNLTLLQKVALSANRLTSSIPANLWDLENLLFLDLSFNFLSGYLSPNMKVSIVIERVDLSQNQLVGNIPSVLGAFESLSYLKLSRNSFQGPIPKSLGDLRALDFLDLSYNNLSGTIPKSLETLPHLKLLNLSFNELTGEIPTKGHFANFTAESFLGNKELCGKQIVGFPSCKFSSTQKSKAKQIVLRYILPAAIASIVIMCVAITYMLRKNGENKVQTPTSACNLLSGVEHRMISYQQLCQATNNFSESCLLGEGSFGSVYKGILSDGTTVAIKVLNLQLENAFKSFETECKVLGAIRHRNLVKIISSCSNSELRALILQYMPNGSLEKWLHSSNCNLDLFQRIGIIVDVASALEYLHHGLAEPVVHCDVKPSNVLLDEDMVAHVTDFGIAKILAEIKYATLTKTLGTLGYIAPEYGSEGKVSTQSDVYSYGIMLFEIFTGKKPTDQMFATEFTLRKWVCKSFPHKMNEVVDGYLLKVGEDDLNVRKRHGILFSIMELGLECTKEQPGERIDMKEVVAKLTKIKVVIGNTEI